MNRNKLAEKLDYIETQTSRNLSEAVIAKKTGLRPGVVREITDGMIRSGIPEDFVIRSVLTRAKER